MSGSMSRRPLTQVMKHSENSLGFRAFIRSFSASWLGMPSLYGRNPRRKSMWSSPQVLHLDEVIGANDGSAQDQQQDLREWVDHFDTLPWILQHCKVMQQGRRLGRVIHGFLRIGAGHPRIT